MDNGRCANGEWDASLMENGRCANGEWTMGRCANGKWRMENEGLAHALDGTDLF